MIQRAGMYKGAHAFFSHGNHESSQHVQICCTCQTRLEGATKQIVIDPCGDLGKASAWTDELNGRIARFYKLVCRPHTDHGSEDKAARSP